MKTEAISGLNNTNSNRNELQGDVGIDRNGEGEIVSEDLKAEEKERAKVELTPEEELREIESEAATRQQEINRLVGSIGETKTKLREAREGLGLPQTDEDPPSVFSSRDKLNKLQAEQATLATRMSELRQSLGSEIQTDENSQEVRENQEQRETVMETARADRADLLKNSIFSRTKDFVTSPLFLKALNYVPVIADVGLASGAFLGREGSRKIGGGERFCYTAALGMALLSYFHAYEGNLTAAGIDTVIINAIMTIDTAPVAIKKAAEALEQKSPKIAHMMNAVGDFLLKKREELVNLKELLKRNPVVLSPEGNAP